MHMRSTSQVISKVSAGIEEQTFPEGQDQGFGVRFGVAFVFGIIHLFLKL